MLKRYAGRLVPCLSLYSPLKQFIFIVAVYVSLIRKPERARSVTCWERETERNAEKKASIRRLKGRQCCTVCSSLFSWIDSQPVQLRPLSLSHLHTHTHTRTRAHMLLYSCVFKLNACKNQNQSDLLLGERAGVHLRLAANLDVCICAYVCVHTCVSNNLQGCMGNSLQP